ncbi:MAG: DUF393 domain-containing protein [Nitrospira sp.]|nr:DUF393 domain-containing protein [Nitrospira sp.]
MAVLRSANPQESASPPPPRRPVLIYDGDCGFCRRCVGKLNRLTANQIECLDRLDPHCRARFPTLSPEALAMAVHFVGTDGRVARGAEAMFRAAALNPRWHWPLRAYLKSRFVAWMAETGYRLVAKNRMFFSRVTRPWLPESGDVPPGSKPSSCAISRKDK